MTPDNTQHTSEKCSAACARIASMHGQTNVSSTPTRANTLGICCPPRASRCQSPVHPGLARAPEKLGHHVFPGVCQLLLAVHLWLLRNYISTHPPHPEERSLGL